MTSNCRPGHPEAPVVVIDTEQEYVDALGKIERLRSAPEGSVEYLLMVAYGDAIERYLDARNSSRSPRQPA
ncbi:hypothetical protein OIU35_15250 [Boseaceae bacterium BT-24-1]|nr:hypothetical protein [Boseaceae bacterium BT-24-1]